MKKSTVLLVSVAGLMLASAANAGDFGGRTMQSGPGDHMVMGGDKHGWSWHRHFKKWNPPPHTDCPTTPEPGTWAMMIVGAGLVGFQLRRKQQALSSLSV